MRGGTQADIAAAGARELLRRGGNFHIRDLVMRLVDEFQPGRSVREIAELGRLLRAETGTVEGPTTETFPLLGHGNGLFWERPTIWLDVEANATLDVLGGADDGCGGVPFTP